MVGSAIVGPSSWSRRALRRALAQGAGERAEIEGRAQDHRQVLDAVDRRTPIGKRDYATMLLLVTYGLRANEVAKLTLDDIDWKNERLRVPERKAGHSTAYPLSTVVGEAIVDYLKNGRPQTQDRHIFFRCPAPRS